MSQWIRWKGVIPFVLITVALTLFFLLFLDSLVKSIIESKGSDMVGARVETQNVDVHLSPLGISIDGLQVSNPEHPMSNAVEIKQIRFGLAGDKLLMGKVIIEQMDVEQLRFDTPRSKSGAISKPASPQIESKNTATESRGDSGIEKPSASTVKTESADTGMDMPSLDLPDVDTILAREPLETQKQAEAIATAISNTELDWNRLQNSLPDEKQTKSYKQRAASLAKTNTDDVKQLALAVKGLQSLKSDLNTDMSRINQARKQAQTSLKKLDKDYTALLKAPEADKQRLLKKYTPDARGVGKLSQLLFGNQTGNYLQQGLHWYQKLAPMFAGDGGEEAPEAERQTGKDIRFRENKPSPDFLIRRIHASVQSKQGDFTGQILNVTHQPEIIRKPVSFDFKGQQMSGIGSLHIQGKLDRIDKENILDTVTMDIRKYQISRHSLSNDPSLQLLIDSALSNTRMHAEHRNGRLNGEMNIHIHDAQYDNRANGGEFQQVLVKAFNNVDSFNINAHLSGRLDKPALRISSDLDKRLNKQISAAFNRRINNYRKELNDQIQQATDKQIAPVRKSIDKLRADIEARLKTTEDRYLSQQNAIDRQSRQYQARIDAEKNRAQKALKKKVEDKARDLLKQLQR